MQDDGNLYPGWTIPFITENEIWRVVRLDAEEIQA